ncbi:MAG: indolepyruvate ferredoxin oxidoreductase [Hyphomicrobiales bacterium]|nr:indolepyruvate ferredoxin oxidoreductase [Hyphomicrobiales bacterium]MCP5371852.1 indolepyruvate ferredoxin oxidoreductase [Hyphomicrobiales bacterium]
MEAGSTQLMSGNEAVARGVWEAGVTVGAAYPGTPSTEILENLSRYAEIHTHWSVNEKTSLEVTIGASVAGARAFCAMKHVGMNVASDALMSQTLAGVGGGLVIAVADDVGFSSSQNEQDTRYWGRFAHLPILEPSDSAEAYAMVKEAYEISEKFGCPVILRMTTRICHVKALVQLGEREVPENKGFTRDPRRWVMVPANAKARQQVQFQRDADLVAEVEGSDLNFVDDGADRSLGFVASGPAFMNVREAYPDAPVFKLGFSCPLPVEKIRAFAATVDTLLVVEETEPLVENELKAAGMLDVHGCDVLPRFGEMMPDVIRRGVARLRGEEVPEPQAAPTLDLFPRPPTMCVGCPHLPAYYCLSRLTRNTYIAGDIGCYTLGAGHPWQALDTTTCMGSSMGMSLGMSLGKAEVDAGKAVVGVIGDSTFLHMGMQGLLEMTYNKGNITVMLLDNSTTAMTGGQENPASGMDIHGAPAPKVDFAKLSEALGVNPARIKRVDPYELPTLFRTIKEEIKHDEPSVIITNRPCVLIDRFAKQPPLKVVDEDCTGCTNCLNVGCPAIQVTRREEIMKPNGKVLKKAWTRIDTVACTGCNVCLQTCGPNAIVPAYANVNPATETATPAA